MKKKSILLVANIIVFFCTLNAQRIDEPQVFVAVTEEEIYKLHE